jgi:hypothetical protein
VVTHNSDFVYVGVMLLLLIQLRDTFLDYFLFSYSTIFTALINYQMCVLCLNVVWISLCVIPLRTYTVNSLWVSDGYLQGCCHRVWWEFTDVSEAIYPMMKADITSEASVNIYQATWLNTEEDNHFHTHRRENLKSHPVTDSRIRPNVRIFHHETAEHI